MFLVSCQDSLNTSMPLQKNERLVLTKTSMQTDLLQRISTDLLNYSRPFPNKLLRSKKVMSRLHELDDDEFEQYHAYRSAYWSNGAVTPPGRTLSAPLPNTTPALLFRTVSKTPNVELSQTLPVQLSQTLPAQPSLITPQQPLGPTAETDPTPGAGHCPSTPRVSSRQTLCAPCSPADAESDPSAAHPATTRP